MKYLKVISLLVLLFLVGCGLAPSATVLMGTNIEFEDESTEYVGRLGVQAEQTEFGVASQWRNRVEDEQHTVGVYVLQNLINDPNMPIIGNSYLGAQATIDYKNEDGGSYGPFVGTVVTIGGVEILTEFHYHHFSEALAHLNGDRENKYMIYIGPRFKL